MRGRGLLRYHLRAIVAVTWKAEIRLPVNDAAGSGVGRFAECECLLSCGHSLPGTHGGRLRARCPQCVMT